MNTHASFRSRLPLGHPPSSARVYSLAGRLVPWLASGALLLMLAGLAAALSIDRSDIQQGDAWRIVVVHVPAAWMSLFVYLLMAFYAVLALVRGRSLASLIMTALAPTGTMFTVVALATGALWGRPIWGAWGGWGAGPASQLILFFLFLL